MQGPNNIIAWLVPTARGTTADQATNMPENNFRAISISGSHALSSRLPDTLSKKPQKAIQLSFDQAPKRPGAFILGTDPNFCDIVLPNLPGVSPMHCALGFDSECRLVLDDFSEQGTQVWYDWECNGDQVDYSWVLSSGYSHGFPNTVRRIIIDIQGVQFQVIVEDHSRNWAAYQDEVDAFCEQPSWVDGLSPGWDRASVSPVPPLFSAAPIIQHITVKSHGPESVGEVYLWDMARPWEPMVKALV